jgi:hypothetical protein
LIKKLHISLIVLTGRRLSSGSGLLLDLSLLLLLAKAGDGAEDRGALARGAAALAGLLFLLLFLLVLLGLFRLVLGLVLSLGLSSLGLGGLLRGGGSSSGKDGLAQGAVGLLVGLALGDSGGELLGLGLLGLQGSNPGITLSGVGSFERVLMAGDGEEEDGRAFCLDVGDLRLDEIVSIGCIAR